LQQRRHVFQQSNDAAEDLDLGRHEPLAGPLQNDEGSVVLFLSQLIMLMSGRPPFHRLVIGR
jgi:hypothetical protein